MRMESEHTQMSVRDPEITKPKLEPEFHHNLSDLPFHRPFLYSRVIATGGSLQLLES